MVDVLNSYDETYKLYQTITPIEDIDHSIAPILRLPFRTEIQSQILDHIHRCYDWYPDAVLNLKPYPCTTTHNFMDALAPLASTVNIMSQMGSQRRLMEMAKQETGVILNKKLYLNFLKTIDKQLHGLSTTMMVYFSSFTFEDKEKNIKMMILPCGGEIIYFGNQNMLIFDNHEFMVSLHSSKHAADQGDLTLQFDNVCIAQHMNVVSNELSAVVTKHFADVSRCQTLEYLMKVDDSDSDVINGITRYRSRCVRFLHRQVLTKTQHARLLLKNRGYEFNCRVFKDGKTYDHLISQAMMNGGGNIRYRGTFKSESVNGEVKYTRVMHDDDIKYEEDEKGQVTVDELNQPLKERQEMMIGWKVVKMGLGSSSSSSSSASSSVDSEFRILKLGIPVEAEVIIPIESDYCLNGGKMRCSQCIVMDIQLPLRDEEKSVVPDEMTAHSCLYDDKITNYRVGQTVYPDAFDRNTKKSCTAGIHFFKHRATVFDTYLNNML